jgi:hypothetical protein
MPRIDPITDAEARFLTRRVFDAARRDGKVPDPLRLMAHSGGTMWAAGLFETAFDRAQSVPKKLKVLVCLKSASMIGCLF